MEQCTVQIALLCYYVTIGHSPKLLNLLQSVTDLVFPTVIADDVAIDMTEVQPAAQGL